MDRLALYYSLGIHNQAAFSLAFGWTVMMNEIITDGGAQTKNNNNNNNDDKQINTTIA